MQRWAILGEEQDPNAEGSASMFRNLEPYRVRRHNGKIRFASKLSIFRDEPLLKFSKWIGSEDDWSPLDFREYGLSLGLPEINRTYIDPNEAESLASRLDEIEGIKKFERFSRFVFYSSLEQLPSITEEILFPKFFNWHPRGKILFLTSSPDLHLALGCLRMAGAARDLPEFDYSKGHDVPSFRMLADIQKVGVFYSSKYLSIPLAIFLPRMYGFVANKVSLGYMFQFETPVDDVREFFPRSGLEFFRSEASNLFHQDIKLDLRDISPENVDTFRFIEREFRSSDIRTFVKQYLSKLKNFLAFMIDPSNFVNVDTGEWIGLEQYRIWLAFERMADELIFLLTDDQPFLRKMALFRILDQLSTFATREGHLQAAVFKDLILPSNSRDPIKSGLQEYRGNVARHLERMLTRIRDDLRAAVLESIYLPGRHSVTRHAVVLTDGEELSEDDFVRVLVRELRNTYHGYHTRNFEKYLAISTGNTPDKLAMLAALVFLALISKPNMFIGTEW